jgi:hypothetical protein
LICHSYFSDKQIIFYEFCKIVPFSEISGNKIGGRTFLYQGQIDPWSLTGGARGPPAGHAGAEARAALAMAGSCRRPRRRRSSTGKEGERGPVRPGAHQEAAGMLGLAGEGRSAANFAAAVLRSGEVSTTVVATPGVLARFVGQGGRGRGGAPSRLVGEARGSVERRPYSAAMAAVAGVHGREREPERGGGEDGEPRVRGDSGGLLIGDEQRRRASWCQERRGIDTEQLPGMGG